MKRIVTILLIILLLAGCENHFDNDYRHSEAGITEGTTLNGFDCDALFFGDSITCDGNFDALFPDLRIMNLGVYGDTLEDLLRRVPEVKAENSAKIFLLGGINSLGPDNVEECLEEYADLLDALRSACPGSELIVQSVLPIGREVDWDGEINDAVRRFNSVLRLLAEGKGCAFVDLYAAYEKDGALDPALTRDGVHLNFNAYGPWAVLVAPYLK